MIMDQKNMRLKSILSILSLFCTVIAMTCKPIFADEAKFFQIGTGPLEGTYYPIGRAIANIISHPPDLPPCKAGQACGVYGLIAITKSTEGSVENIQRMQEGDIQSALAQADIAHLAFTGQSVFSQQGAYKDLRVIAYLYTEHVHIVTAKSSDIQTLQDLRDKHIAIGKPHSGTINNAKKILEYLGFQEKDFRSVHQISSGQAADMMREGKLDAFFLTAGYPVEIIEELAKENIADLLSISPRNAHQLQGLYPYFGFENIPANLYSNISQKNVMTIPAIWVAHKDLPNQLVYNITEALWHDTNQEKLRRAYSRGLSLAAQKKVDYLQIPFHPAALQYYKSIEEKQ